MYDDYTQSFLGYPFQNSYDRQVGYEDDSQWKYYGYRQNDLNMYTSSNEEIENMYPEIYNLIYPMVRKACMRNVKPITSEVIEEMTDEIYRNIETGNIINLNVNVENSTFENNRGENKEESRTCENRRSRGLIGDMIKILLIRELTGKCSGCRPRPPRYHRPDDGIFPPWGPRPEMPPRIPRY